jgi:hypothetical protein
MQVRLRHPVPDDASSWEKLRCALWPDGVSDHGPEIASFFAGTLDDVAAVLIAEDESGAMVGFAELSIRTDLAGLGGKLLQASRNWAYRQDYAAFASDRAERIIIDRSFAAKRLRSGQSQL